MQLFITGFFAFFSCMLLVILSYQYIDQGVALWIFNHNLTHLIFLKWFPHIPEMMTTSLLVIYPVLVTRFCFNKYTVTDKNIMAMANSIAITYFLHEPLKDIFGRYWPSTLLDNVPSVLNNGEYRFNWFHHGDLFSSFPSGHAAVITAAMTVLVMAYPRTRWYAVTLTGLVMISLLALDYHFVGDIIAGAFLGGITAFYTAKISGIKPTFQFTRP